ncbi:hypothetical protein [Phormidium sp. CCY1219]|uniref:hypothetical protein n=1 Tax=Phormidium sp. CCY1219 TaxID=2886104 RepID=UPI002D1EC312|nr:hypothetical protein [Phormidium sp. CCY1219]MEB3826982.1 hypothetical protein [Phormidium sp. CCY1219]
MAKRRNPKKEKALRNQEYARRFRKRTSNSRFGGKRRFGADRSEDTSKQNGSDNNDDNDNNQN